MIEKLVKITFCFCQTTTLVRSIHSFIFIQIQFDCICLCSSSTRTIVLIIYFTIIFSFCLLFHPYFALCVYVNVCFYYISLYAICGWHDQTSFLVSSVLLNYLAMFRIDIRDTRLLSQFVWLMSGMYSSEQLL